MFKFVRVLNTKLLRFFLWASTAVSSIAVVCPRFRSGDSNSLLFPTFPYPVGARASNASDPF